MTFSFGFSFSNLGDDRVDLVLPGVGGDDGAGAAVLPVSGDMDFFPDLVTLIVTLGGGGLFFPASALSRARRTAICNPGCLLSLSENLHARIACGTVDAGHFKMNATVVAMRLSACPPLPDMLTKTFHQSESRLCGGGTSNRRSNTCVHDTFASFCAHVAT
jgi:hypothetical protein